MDICIYHINVPPNHIFSHLFSLIKMSPCQTLLSDLFLLLFTDSFHLSLSLSLAVSLCLCLSNSSCCLSPQLLQSQHSCHQAVSANHGAADHCASDHYPDLSLCWSPRCNTAWYCQSCHQFCWCHLQTVVPAKRVSTATGMWVRHAEVLLWLTSYYCTPISSSICILDHSCNSELQMVSGNKISSCVP